MVTSSAVLDVPEMDVSSPPSSPILKSRGKRRRRAASTVVEAARQSPAKVDAPNEKASEEEPPPSPAKVDAPNEKASEEEPPPPPPSQEWSILPCAGSDMSDEDEPLVPCKRNSSMSASLANSDLSVASVTLQDLFGQWQGLERQRSNSVMSDETIVIDADGPAGPGGASAAGPATTSGGHGQRRSRSPEARLEVVVLEAEDSANDAAHCTCEESATPPAGRRAEEDRPCVCTCSPPRPSASGRVAAAASTQDSPLPPCWVLLEKLKQ